MLPQGICEPGYPTGGIDDVAKRTAPCIKWDCSANGITTIPRGTQHDAENQVGNASMSTTYARDYAGSFRTRSGSKSTEFDTECSESRDQQDGVTRYITCPPASITDLPITTRATVMGNIESAGPVSGNEDFAQLREVTGLRESDWHGVKSVPDCLLPLGIFDQACANGKYVIAAADRKLQ